MPIYAYRCEACGFAKDVLQKLSDAPLTECLSCGKATFKKQLTAAGFQLKGSGWYVTDFRGGSTSGAPAVEAGKSGATTSGNTAASAGETSAASGSAGSAGSGVAASSQTDTAAKAPPSTNTDSSSKSGA